MGGKRGRRGALHLRSPPPRRADLHLLPGLIGGVASAIAAASLDSTLPFSYARFTPASLAENFPMWGGRSGLEQGALQLAVTGISLGFGLLSGALTGRIMTLPAFEPKTRLFYDDGAEWEMVRAPRRRRGGKEGGPAYVHSHHDPPPQRSLRRRPRRCTRGRASRRRPPLLASRSPRPPSGPTPPRSSPPLAWAPPQPPRKQGAAMLCACALLRSRGKPPPRLLPRRQAPARLRVPPWASTTPPSRSPERV